MNIATPQAIPSLTIAGRVFTDLKNLKVLIGGMNGAVNGVSTFRTMAGTPYVVPAAKSFRIVAAEAILCVAGAAGTSLSIGYADNDCGVQTNTARTNAVLPGNYAFSQGEFNTGATNNGTSKNMNFLVPTGKYPYVNNGGTAAVGIVYIYGYEE